MKKKLIACFVENVVWFNKGIETDADNDYLNNQRAYIKAQIEMLDSIGIVVVINPESNVLITHFYIGEMKYEWNPILRRFTEKEM